MEKGIYYALDLGGTNFRVLRVKLGGERAIILDPDVEREPIPQHLMTSTIEVTDLYALLPFLALCEEVRFQISDGFLILSFPTFRSFLIL